MTSPDDQDRDDEPRSGGSSAGSSRPGQGPEEQPRGDSSRNGVASSTSTPSGSDESIAELERREELLRDSRASVERMLRLGTVRPRSAGGRAERIPVEPDRSRDARLSEAEADARSAPAGSRRGRAEARGSVERRERAVEAREEQSSPSSSNGARRARRRVTPPDAGARGARRSFPATATGSSRSMRRRSRCGYRLRRSRTQSSSSSRIARSPLPGDARRCAYLVRGMRGDCPESGGSS